MAWKLLIGGLLGCLVGALALGQERVPVPIPVGAVGEFSMVSINTHGLPLADNGKARHRAIGELLNSYDLALVQEDFAFHKPLGETAMHPYRSPHNTKIFLFYIYMGDGLNRFSYLEFNPFWRERWERCNGLFNDKNDCLARKGFSVGETVVADGLSIDVYNLHADAGDSSGDVEARWIQFQQLAQAIREVSPGRAIIVAGDTNLRVTNEQNGEIAEWFQAETGLVDACDATDCCVEFPDYCAVRVDRILFRSGDAVTLAPSAFWIDPAFSNHPDLGRLSDHTAKAAQFSWQENVNPPVQILE
jgi:hypothetical protein